MIWVILTRQKTGTHRFSFLAIGLSAQVLHIKRAPQARNPLTYAESIAAPARRRGFPDWYLARIDSFRSGPILDEED